MFEFLNFFKKAPPTSDIAKERLKLIIIHDRSHVSPELLEKLKEEILEVVSKYIVIDEKELNVCITNTIGQDGKSKVPALMANIPISGVNNKTG